MEIAKQAVTSRLVPPDGAFFQIRHYPEVLRARGWPEIGLWTPQGHTRKWKECFPDNKLAVPVAADRSREELPRTDRVNSTELQLVLPGCGTFSQASVRSVLHYRKWIRTIPDEILQEARRYKLHAYRVLKILSLSHPAGLELSRSSGHILILGLADRLRQKHFDLQRTGKLLKRPRREIANYLGMPATKSTIKILAKTELCTSIEADVFFHQLERLFSDQVATNRARHLSCITWDVLEILTDERLLAVCSLDLLEAMASRSEYPFDIKGTLTDTQRMWRDVHRGRPMPVVQSEQQLHRLHSELTLAFNAFRQKEHMSYLKQLKFPNPPVPGSEAIIPITTGIELLREGQLCHHCVGSFYQEVTHGKCYVYRVLEPERATLMLSPSKRGIWQVAEVRAPCNREIQLETQNAIARWLDEKPGGSAV